MPDYVQSTLDLLMATKHRLAVTPADYAQAVQWEQQGIPWSIVEKVIQEKAQRSQGKGWLPGLRLDWLDAEMQDAYTDWRRAVGPWAPSEPGAWRDECDREHGGTYGSACSNSRFHAAKMASQKVSA